MNNHDHPQNTIDVKQLFENSPENLNLDPSPASPPSQNSQGAPERTSAQNPRQQNALDPNYVAQQTQTIPQENANVASPRSYPQTSIEPEDLNGEDQNSDDESDSDKRRKILIICICAGVLTVLLGLIGLIILIANPDENDDPNANTGTVEASGRIVNNVYAGGIDLSGKTLEQAQNLLRLKTDHTFSSESMVVKIPGSTLTLSPENTGAKLDVDAVAIAALKCGTDGNISSDGTYNIDLLDYLTLNSEYIKETIDAFCKEHSSVLTDPVVKLEGTRPQFNPEEISSEYQNQSLVITLGTPEYTLDSIDMYNQVLDAYAANHMEVIYSGPEKVEPDTPDVDDLYEQYCTPAQDAILDMASYEITPEIYGYGFDVQELQQAIDNADYGETISITFKILKPAIVSSDLSKNMFIDTLAEYQNSSSTDDSKRNNNISLACTALDGYVINAGDTFSFNDAIGKFSTKNGYATAPIDKFNGSVMGGGVTQTASALYVCALVANLDIMERHNHEYAVDFCELGLDAFVDGEANDLRFKNNTKSPIRILAEATGGRIRIEILGVNNLDYDVEIVPKTVSEIKPLTTYQNMDANNALGYADGDILQSGITGYKISLIMEKYDRATGTLISSLEVETSEYAKLDEVVARIAPVVTDPTEPEPSDPTTPTEGTDVTGPTTVPDPSDPTVETPPEPTDPTVDTPEPTDPTVDPSTEPTEPDGTTLPELNIPIPDFSPVSF